MAALDQDQRDTLYRAVILDLGGLSDVYKMLDRGHGYEARDERQRFEDDWRLLDDLGWDADDRRDRFELTMPAEQQERILSYFYNAARDTVPTAEDADEELDLMSACRASLPDLDRQAS